MMLVLSRFYYMPDRPLWYGALFACTALFLAAFLGSAVVYFLSMALHEKNIVSQSCRWSAAVTCAIAVVLSFESFKVLRMASAAGIESGSQTGSGFQGGSSNSTGSGSKNGTDNGSGKGDDSGYGTTPSFLQEK
jgi:uncharacterized membrane protein YgcG